MEKLDINDLTVVEPWASANTSHTDIKRLRQGKMGAQVFIFLLVFFNSS